MTIALYAGSFDPITNGHIDIISKATKIFDKVIIAVANNSSKSSFFSVDERLLFIQMCTTLYNNIEITSYNGLTTNYAKKCGATVLIRGVRNTADFEYEMQLAHSNNCLNPSIQTILLPTDCKYSFISSSAVREIIKHDGDVSKFVPEYLIKFLTNKKIID